MKKLVKLAVAFLTLIRVGLYMTMPVMVYADQMHDDRLLFNYAESLISGNWLGTYNYLTLVKGISYSAFIAVCSKLFIPYTLGLALLGVGAAFVFIKAIQKIISNEYVLWAIYLLLIYAPITMTNITAQRLYRMSIIAPAVLLVIACFIGLFLRRKESLKALLPWALGAGASLAFFWHIREDSIWLMPFCVVLLACGFLLRLLEEKNIKAQKNYLIVCLIPFVMLIASTIAISLMNLKEYGIYTENDKTDTEFAKLVEVIYAMEDEDAPEDVWLSYKGLQKLESFSPTLQTVSAEVETAYLAWGGGSDVTGDYVVWAFRDGFREAGYYDDAVEVNEFCAKINAELDEAKKDGRLKYDDKLRIMGSAEGLDDGEFASIMRYAFSDLTRFSTYSECVATDTTGYTGEYDEVRKLEGMMGIRSVQGEQDVILPWGHRAVVWYNNIMIPYKALGGFLAVVGIIIWLILTIDVILDLKKKIYGPKLEIWLCATGMVLSAFALALGIEYFSRWFPDELRRYILMYCAGCQYLLQIPKYLMVYYGISRLVYIVKDKMRGRKTA